MTQQDFNRDNEQLKQLVEQDLSNATVEQMGKFTWSAIIIGWRILRYLEAQDDARRISQGN